MTDNEIIKALECCKKPAGTGACKDCPYDKNRPCTATMLEDALDLINRQKAEIESLKNDLAKEFTCFVGSPHKVEHCPFFDELEKERAEVIKEFAEELKERFNNLEYNARTTRKTVKTDELREQMDWVLHMVAPKTIDNLVKEMVGESDV